MKNYEDKIYSLGETVTGQTQAMSQAVQKTLESNGGVGIMTGSYDQNLSILSVDNLLLHSTGSVSYTHLWMMQMLICIKINSYARNIISILKESD